MTGDSSHITIISFAPNPTLCQRVALETHPTDTYNSLISTRYFLTPTHEREEGRKTKAEIGESHMVWRREKKHGRKEQLKINISNTHSLSPLLFITHKLERK